jgi:hypothetical protein
MKRCSRCLLPETFPNIRYNGDGVCNYCLSYTPIEYKGEPKLEELLDTYRNRNKGEKYDCVVPVSGGRDSTFTLYELVEAYDMRVLAYNYDNGFGSEQADLNLKRMTDALGVDLVTIKHDQTKYFRNNLIALSKKVSPAMVPTLCLGCRYGIVSGACKVAMRYKVPLVFFSSSRLEKPSFKKEFFKTRVNNKPFFQKESFTKEILYSIFNKKVVGMASEFFSNPFYFKPSFVPMYVRDYFSHLPPLSPWLKLLYGKVRIVEFFDYVKWDEKRIENTIENELKWKKPKEAKSSGRFDCLVRYFKDYFYLNSVGFAERDEQLSNMIREGMISRAEALQRLMEENQREIRENIIGGVLEELKIDKSILHDFRGGNEKL